MTKRGKAGRGHADAEEKQTARFRRQLLSCYDIIENERHRVAAKSSSFMPPVQGLRSEFQRVDMLEVQRFKRQLVMIARERGLVDQLAVAPAKCANHDVVLDGGKVGACECERSPVRR